MSGESGASRWWENYLVRYLMPSIAGVAIISWLLSVACGEFKAALFFGSNSKSLDAPTLTLLILYGNLFCYIASYPILCFHATRVVDYKEYAWNPSPFDGYALTAALAVLMLLSVTILSGRALIVSIFVLFTVFAGAQIWRIFLALSAPHIKGYTSRKTSLVYAFLVTLSKRRGVLPERTVVTTLGQADEEDEEQKDPNAQNNQKTSIQTETKWRSEFMDSYKHMREHGNSAFIFVLELVLAGACYGVIRVFEEDAVIALSVIGVLLVIWSAPSVLVHLLGQHLERRFSLFDRRL